MIDNEKLNPIGPCAIGRLEQYQKNVILLGGLLMDRYFVVDQYPARGQDGYILDTFDRVGGCAINMAATIRNLGGVPFIVSCLGKDAWGNEIFDYLKAEGFPVDCVRQMEGKTGYCMVFMEEDGERTFLTREGCEGYFEENLIPENIAASADIAIVTGYYLLDETADRMVSFLGELKNRGISILFDPSPLVDKIAPEVLAEAMAVADILTPNEVEAAFLSGGIGGAAWAALMVDAGKTVVLKRGAQGGSVYGNEAPFDYPAYSACVVDTTGAGDSFAGALALALAEGQSLKAAVRIAAACAARSTEIKGPHGYFTRAEIEQQNREVE